MNYEVVLSAFCHFLPIFAPAFTHPTGVNGSFGGDFHLTNHNTMSQKIRIKLKSFDHMLVDKSAEKIVKAVKSTGAIVSGPIPLPTDKEIYTVLRSPHVNKKAREQFQLCTYKRLVDIYSSSAKTVDALMKLELPSGVDVEIKV